MSCYFLKSVCTLHVCRLVLFLKKSALMLYASHGWLLKFKFKWIKITWNLKISCSVTVATFQALSSHKGLSRYITMEWADIEHFYYHRRVYWIAVGQSVYPTSYSNYSLNLQKATLKLLMKKKMQITLNIFRIFCVWFHANESFFLKNQLWIHKTILLNIRNLR